MLKLANTQIYVDAVLHDAGMIELRHIGGDKRTTSGIFDNATDLLTAARQLHADGNLYCTLNAPKLRIIKNRMGSDALKDDDIAFITRLPFDFDPIRPTGSCSTAEELADAEATRDQFMASMHRRGWPLPMVGMSGNGAHAVYRCRLPSNSETREALTALYYGLHGEHDSDLVDFDRTVRNPSRIFRLYGSVNRKGPNLIDRPHRQSFCRLPTQWRQVTQRQIMALADSFVKRPTAPSAPPKPSGPISGDGDYSTLDVVAWFTAHGLYKRPSPDGAGKHYVTCPWVNEHSSPDHPAKTDTVVWEASGGWPNFHCSHAHCEGRGIRDVLNHMGDADAFCSTEWRAKR